MAIFSAFLILLGVIGAIKLSLWVQTAIVVIFILFAKGMGRGKDGLETMFLYVIPFALIVCGLVLGDVLFYSYYYKGDVTIGDAIGWFFRP